MYFTSEGNLFLLVYQEFLDDLFGFRTRFVMQIIKIMPYFQFLFVFGNLCRIL